MIEEKYTYAKYWAMLFPIICEGNKFAVMETYKFLLTLDNKQHIVKLLKQCAINKLSEFGIDYNFVY